MLRDSFGFGRAVDGRGFLRRSKVLKEGVRFSLYSDRFSAPRRDYLEGCGNNGLL